MQEVQRRCRSGAGGAGWCRGGGGGAGGGAGLAWLPAPSAPQQAQYPVQGGVGTPQGPAEPVQVITLSISSDNITIWVIFVCKEHCLWRRISQLSYRRKLTSSNITGKLILRGDPLAARCPLGAKVGRPRNISAGRPRQCAGPRAGGEGGRLG